MRLVRRAIQPERDSSMARTLGERQGASRRFCMSSDRRLAWIIHGHTLTRSASEGVVKVRPRWRFGLVCGTSFP